MRVQVNVSYVQVAKTNVLREVREALEESGLPAECMGVELTESGYLDMTGRPMAETQAFLAEAQRLGIPLWIRHVLVPGFTDSRAHLAQLKRFVDSLQHVQRVELLPDHLLGVHKYETMQLPYSLSGVPAMDQEKAAQLQEEFFPQFPPT